MPAATKPLYGSDVEINEAVSELIASKFPSDQLIFAHLLIDDVTASRSSDKTETLLAVPHIQVISEYAYHYGLSALHLQQLLDIITLSNSLTRASRVKIIKSLYPACKVSSDLVCTMVSSLGYGVSKPAATVQCLLLRWIIMIYDVLEDSSILSNLYSVLFNMLDMLSLRALLCQLLAMITRKKHVKPFRIQYLQALSTSLSREPSLTGLLRTFESYCSDPPFEETAKGRASAFSHPDTAWRDRLQIIQQENGFDAGNSRDEPFSFTLTRRGMKKPRVAGNKTHLERSGQKSSITLEAINGVNDLIDNLENVVVPPQLISAIDDPLLQRYLELRSNAEAIAQMDGWLTLFFDQQLKKAEQNQMPSKALSNMFSRILNYTRYSKTLPNAAQSFFTRYLSIWNGKEDRDVILSLLSYVTVQPFEDLQSDLFKNLETALLDNNPQSTTILLEFYTTLLRRWTAQLLTPHPSTSIAPALKTLITHSSLLALTLLTSSPPHPSTLSATISHYSALSSLITHHPTLQPPNPEPLTIYLLAFLSPSLPTLSGLCSILAAHKLALEAAPPTARLDIATFNGFLMDLCNLLWRSRAFNTTDTNALGCLFPASLLSCLTSYLSSLTTPLDTPAYTLSSVFSLSHNPTLAALSFAAFREREDRAEGTIAARHAGPVGQRSLNVLAEAGGIRVGWKEYRVEVLEWLDERGVKGVGELMGCTMKGLMGKEGGGNGGGGVL